MSPRRSWARPLTPLYAAAQRLTDTLRRDPRRLRWPVVSVGSLSAGGAGKTPVVIALARLLKESGWDVDVLSRGYGREGRAVERVAASSETQISFEVDKEDSYGLEKKVSMSNAAAAARFGDEPVLIAERAQVPVFVGASRFSAGLLAEREKGNAARALHLLDDGFQHRQLARTVDILLITAEDLDDALLPAGNLREPLTALRRADVVVVRDDEVEHVAKRVWPLLREGAQMWKAHRRLHFPAPALVFGAGLRPVAFCALARPEGFAAMLAEAGCGIVETVAFRDHHRFELSDMDRVVAVARGLNATGFVTTEKDAVKLSPAMRARLEQLGPVMVVALQVDFGDPRAIAAYIASAVEHEAGVLR